MSGIISLSEASSIGLHACLLLARSEGRMLRTQQIAESLDVSAAHLSKVLQRLGRAGLVEAVRGPRGGTRLARPASEISLLEVYEAIDGRFSPSTCLLSRPICEDGSCCLLGGLLQDLNGRIREHLSRTSLSEACNGVRNSVVTL
jgi:Rrf2 family protein